MNNAGFDIERSPNGNNWTAIGFVAAQVAGSIVAKMSLEIDGRSLPTGVHSLVITSGNGTTKWQVLIR